MFRRYLDFVEFDLRNKKKPGKSSVLQIKFPYPGAEEQGRRGLDDCNYCKQPNIIKNVDCNIYCVLNPILNKKEWIYLKIFPEKNGFKIQNIEESESSFYLNGHFTNMNSNGNNILTNYGDIIDLDKENNYKFGYNIYYDSTKGKIDRKEKKYLYYPQGAMFVGKNEGVIQNAGSDTKIGGYRCYENILLFLSRKDGLLKEIKSGFSKTPLSYKSEIMSPLDISPDKDNVAFWAYYPRDVFLPVYKNENKQCSLWLSIWNLRDNKISKIIRLASFKFDVCEHFAKKLFIKYSPDPQYPLIAVTPEKNIVIVDYKKKEIVKTIEKGLPKSLRWSPDGKKLGFMMEDGKLYVYDLEKDSLKMIDEDNDYFDFFWVPGG